MENKIYTRSAWSPSESLWTATVYIKNAKDLLEKRGQTQDVATLNDLLARIEKLADRFDEETEAQHQLDVSCIVNAGCN